MNEKDDLENFDSKELEAMIIVSLFRVSSFLRDSPLNDLTSKFRITRFRAHDPNVAY
jgi:hypothetical protein